MVGLGHLIHDELADTHVALRDALGAQTGSPNEWDDNWGIDMDAIEEAKYRTKAHDATAARHHRRRQNQARRWQRDILPSLLQPYLHLLASTQNGRTSVTAPAATSLCLCRTQCTHDIIAVYWDHMKWTSLSHNN